MGHNYAMIPALSPTMSNFLPRKDVVQKAPSKVIIQCSLSGNLCRIQSVQTALVMCSRAGLETKT